MAAARLALLLPTIALVLLAGRPSAHGQGAGAAAEDGEPRYVAIDISGLADVYYPERVGTHRASEWPPTDFEPANSRSRVEWEIFEIEDLVSSILDDHIDAENDGTYVDEIRHLLYVPAEHAATVRSTLSAVSELAAARVTVSMHTLSVPAERLSGLLGERADNGSIASDRLRSWAASNEGVWVTVADERTVPPGVPTDLGAAAVQRALFGWGADGNPEMVDVSTGARAEVIATPIAGTSHLQLMIRGQHTSLDRSNMEETADGYAAPMLRAWTGYLGGQFLVPSGHSVILSGGQVDRGGRATVLVVRALADRPAPSRVNLVSGREDRGLALFRTHDLSSNVEWPNVRQNQGFISGMDSRLLSDHDCLYLVEEALERAGHDAYWVTDGPGYFVLSGAPVVLDVAEEYLAGLRRDLQRRWSMRAIGLVMPAGQVDAFRARMASDEDAHPMRAAGAVENAALLFNKAIHGTPRFAEPSDNRRFQRYVAGYRAVSIGEERRVQPVMADLDYGTTMSVRVTPIGTDGRVRIVTEGALSWLEAGELPTVETPDGPVHMPSVSSVQLDADSVQPIGAWRLRTLPNPQNAGEAIVIATRVTLGD